MAMATAMLPTKAAAQCRKNRLAQIATADFVQIGESDAHNKGRFDTLTQRDYKGLQHLIRGSKGGNYARHHFENEFQFQLIG